MYQQVFFCKQDFATKSQLVQDYYRFINNYKSHQRSTAVGKTRDREMAEINRQNTRSPQLAPRTKSMAKKRDGLSTDQYSELLYS